jgi:hypothetical protein
MPLDVTLTFELLLTCSTKVPPLRPETLPLNPNVDGGGGDGASEPVEGAVSDPEEPPHPTTSIVTAQHNAALTTGGESSRYDMLISPCDDS